MDEITYHLLSRSRNFEDATSPDADMAAKAKAFDEIQAQQQLDALGSYKPGDTVRLKARNKVWANDDLSYFPKEVFDVSYETAEFLVGKRQADVTTEPLSQSAIERHEVLLGQREHSRQQHEQRKRQMATIDAAMRGEF